ncbi:MAG: hypothetical protein R3C20_04090 [Planctomycetaceae bacterium]
MQIAEAVITPSAKEDHSLTKTLCVWRFIARSLFDLDERTDSGNARTNVHDFAAAVRESQGGFMVNRTSRNKGNGIGNQIAIWFLVEL